MEKQVKRKRKTGKIDFINLFIAAAYCVAAIGGEIRGDRLGQGTNLFSERPTLAEEKGFDTLNTEIARYSAYYLNHFA